MARKVEVTLATKKLDNWSVFGRRSRKWHLVGVKNEREVYYNHAFCGKRIGDGFEEGRLVCNESEVCAVCLRNYSSWRRRNDYGSPYVEEE